ncbi:hypothetical protein IE53DRAFT_259607 [Violaceomyces palustris]|uniref:Uncharacterized protein n=1 Tax=Violaceomyces palustris TaxID=1673888 RepID=A0ACD0NN94_9BASI|nr:hypothetical protein IE53DRAFT_259607 [Violaceomyces palustris]
MATRVHPSLARILDEVERSRRGGGGDNANKDEDHDPSDLIGLLSRRVVGTEARVQGEVDSFLSPYHDLPDLESLQDASGDTDHLAKSGSPAIQHQDVDGVEIGRGSDGGGRTSRKVDQRSEKLERMRTSWNSLSRGGSLGDDAGP